MRRNTIVTVIVVAVLAYVFYTIPRLADEQKQVKQYDHYSEFHDDFLAGHIDEVMVVNGQEAEGSFKPTAPGGYDRFAVSVSPDEELVAKLMATAREQDLDVK